MSNEVQTERDTLKAEVERLRAMVPDAAAIAAEVVQSLSDSEPTERSIMGMEFLRGTEYESMFVLDHEEIRDAVVRALSNAAFDATLPKKTNHD